MSRPGEPDELDDHTEDGDEDLPEEEPEGWAGAAICPDCGSEETRFMERRHDGSVYACERCGGTFEVET